MGMIDAAAPNGNLDSLETVLRTDLAHGEAVGESVVPILRHLLANQGNSMFGEEIVARVRGMISDIAGQLLDACAAAAGETELPEHEDDAIAAVSDLLVADGNLVAHVHALALEAQLAAALQSRLSLDPVLSPLVQALVASPDNDASALAMNFLAAQARFVQAQRRMKLPLNELPGDILAAALNVIGSVPEIPDATANVAASTLRGRYDEGRSRLGLIARLVTGMGGGAIAALSISHAGVAIFLTALAIGSSQAREAVTLSTSETQLARLALGLRAAGMKPETVAEQFLALHPDVELPQGFDRIGADRAAAILAQAGLSGA